jgi:hypothetical protein
MYEMFSVICANEAQNQTSDSKSHHHQHGIYLISKFTLQHPFEQHQHHED